MRPVITPAESSRLDAESGIPVGVLMERAGLAVAIAATRMGAGYGARVLVLAGPGNNGGDGYVAARVLRSRGVDVAVQCLGYPRGDSGPNRRHAVDAARAGVPMAALGDPRPCDLIVDALFGAGFRGVLPDPVVPWTRHPAPVLSVDLPSGLDGADGSAGGPVFSAARTVTFGALKTGHLVGSGPALSGIVEVVDIGLPEPKAEWLACEDADCAVPPRLRSAHKWSVGSVAVVGGSAGILGAPVIAARAALQFGAGAVRLLVPSALQPQAAAMDPGLLTGISGDSEADPDVVLGEASRFDVLAVGPGLGGGAEHLVSDLLERWDRPLVLDADGITAASVDSLAGRAAPTVITPHAGEFRELTGEEATPAAASALAEKTGAVVLLKGSPTFVMGEERWVVTSGGPELATIGTGDVLTGMVAALIARGMPAEIASRTAAHRHGQAGAALMSSTTVTATGLLDEIGRFAR